MLRVAIFIFIGPLLLSSCNRKSPDRFIPELIPFGDSTLTYSSGTTHRSHFYNISHALNLDKIDSGYSDYQLRIWLGHSMAVWHNVVIIKCIDQKWNAEVLKYKIVDWKRKTITIKILDHKKVFPTSGWYKFNSLTENFGIIAFVKSQEFKGEGGGDGISYDFELAEGGEYFINSYGNPEYDTTNMKKASSILAFSKMLENEFDFEYIKQNNPIGAGLRPVTRRNCIFMYYFTTQ